MRYFVIKDLGKYFTVDVTIRKNHLLKKDGFYKYIRHPSYSFSILTFLGLGIILNNWYSLLCVFIFPTSAFLYCINIKEKVLIETFREDYLTYCKTTKKIIPFIY